MRAAKCNPQREVQRGLPLALLGNFQRCLQCGSENSLISYGIFCPQIPVRRPSLPACFACLAYQLCIHDNVNRESVICQHCSRHKLPLLFFPFVVGCRGGRFRLQRLFRLGLSDTRFMGRILPEVEGGDCSHNGVAA